MKKIASSIMPWKVPSLAPYVTFQCYTPPLVPTGDAVYANIHPMLGTVKENIVYNKQLIAWRTEKVGRLIRMYYKLPKRKPVVPTLIVDDNIGTLDMATLKETANQAQAQALAEGVTSKAKASVGSALQPAAAAAAAAAQSQTSLQQVAEREPHSAVADIQRSSPEHLPAAIVAARIFAELGALERAAAQVQAHDLTVLGVKSSPSLGRTNIDVLRECKVQLDGLDDLVLKSILVRAKELEVALGSLGIDVDVQALLELPSYTA